MYLIKAVPEDFVVIETGSPQPNGSGPYAYFVLQKRDWNTLEALEAIAAKTKSVLKNYGWAGNKDKQAITTQVCSAKNVGKEQLEKLSLQGITITYLGQGGRPVSLGTHGGNEFTITVRNLEQQPILKSQFINLFGGQRFSSHNVAIGRAIVKKKYDVVIDHLLHDTGRSNMLRDALEKHPTDTLGALRHIPHNLLLLFIHAYQSQLWNVAAQHLAEQKAPQQPLPIIGFGTTEQDLLKHPILIEQMKAEAITTRDFILRQLPSLSSEGGNRELYATAHGLSVGEPQDDELNEGKKKVIVKFTLDKGSYATEFIRQSFGNPSEQP
jgi:tRNA pseudouridine13 synthase